FISSMTARANHIARLWPTCDSCAMAAITAGQQVITGGQRGSGIAGHIFARGGALQRDGEGT
ncbi:MAG: hypothetical protein LC808_17440, partial [Actinobacteria bacterium]|nr:hypothetical protein [Actinomycetota bacterium]